MRGCRIRGGLSLFCAPVLAADEMIYVIVLLVSTLLTAVLTPVAMALGRRMGLVDSPGGRRKHSGEIPRTGGIALFGGFVITLGLTLLLPIILPEWSAGWFPPRNDPNEMRRLSALLAGSLFCVVMGLLDDHYQWPSWPQYLVQLTAALIGMSGLIFVKHVNNPFGGGLLFGPEGFPWWLMAAVTIFWYMGMMNTVNWLDGLDGLVAGVAAILCAVLAGAMIYVANPAQLSVALLPVALMGAAVGFLPFNFNPARIFMGSSGSYFIGFALAALGIIGGARLATVMLVVGLPALDVAWLIYDRNRRGISPGQGGRDHLHFRLLDRGLSERAIVVGYWAYCALLGGMTLVIDSRFYKVVALIATGVVGLGVLVWASRYSPSDSTGIVNKGVATDDVTKLPPSGK
jgi:UDP-GlcNAc:undecaprenyl-phosphate GlcNAc-1-phosphate transferase